MTCGCVRRHATGAQETRCFGTDHQPCTVGQWNMSAWRSGDCSFKAAAMVLGGGGGACLAKVLAATVSIDAAPKLVCVSRAFSWELHFSAVWYELSLGSICSNVHRCSCGTLCARQFTSLLAPLAASNEQAIQPLLSSRTHACCERVPCAPVWHVDERLGVAVVSLGAVYGSILSFDLALPVLPLGARIFFVLSNDSHWANTVSSVFSLPDGLGAMLQLSDVSVRDHRLPCVQ